MNVQLYRSENCPCPSDCVRRGRCDECIAFHRARHEQTYCEYLYEKANTPSPDASVLSGKEIRLLEYSPCAG